MNVKAGNNIKKAANLSGFIKGGNHLKIIFNIYLSEGFSSILLFFIPYAGTISGMGKEKKPSLRFSRSIFPKAHSTADLTSPKSTGFIA